MLHHDQAAGHGRNERGSSVRPVDLERPRRVAMLSSQSVRAMTFAKDDRENVPGKQSPPGKQFIGRPHPVEEQRNVEKWQGDGRPDASWRTWAARVLRTRTNVGLAAATSPRKIGFGRSAVWSPAGWRIVVSGTEVLGNSTWLAIQPFCDAYRPVAELDQDGPIGLRADGALA